MIRASMRAKWVVREDVLARQLSAVPAIRASMFGIGEAVADEARKSLSVAGGPPPGFQYASFMGRHWSVKPHVVARGVGVKDIRDFPTASAKVQGRIAPVALVVADHPYSRTWELGLDGLPALNFLGGALDTVAARNVRLTRRAGTP